MLIMFLLLCLCHRAEFLTGYKTFAALNAFFLVYPEWRAFFVRVFICFINKNAGSRAFFGADGTSNAFFSINNEILEVDTHTTFNNILMNDFNIFFFFNVLRHLDSADLSKWGSWIDNCVNSSVIIHDYNSTLNKLQVHLNCHRIKYSRFKDYIIIKK